jgi:flagellum-specific peptidoglycan hydrolase FlgJ
VIGSLGNKIFPSVTLAQAILESAWGESDLSRNANNFFGIKADASWHGATITLPTPNDSTPTSVFRKYANAADSFYDHVQFFYQNTRYKTAGVLDATTPEQQISDIALAGYAEDPDYANKLIGLVSSYNLKRYDKKKVICELVLSLAA